MGLNGKTVGTLDGPAETIRAACAALNGYDPSPEEVKDLLMHQRIAESTGIDPLTLSRMGDLKHVRLLAKLPGDISAAMKAGIAAMLAVIPTGSELRGRLEAVEAFGQKMERAERTMQRVLNCASATTTVFVAALAILLAMVVAMYRWGYSEGFSSENNRHACAAIGNIFAEAKRERHGQTVADTRNAYFLRGCNLPT